MAENIVRAKKIKGIIAANIHKGEQFCADQINRGGFPGPHCTNKKWTAADIRPMMEDKLSMKTRIDPKYFGVTSSVDEKTLDIMFRNSDTNTGFIRAAILEKIERDKLI